MYNEESSIDTFFNKLIPILEAQNITYEIVCVNDGSKDNTLTALRKWRETEPRIKIIELSRNFGKECALTAGMDATRGRAVVPIDADLQDPPELLADMIAHWRAGAKVVLAQREDRQSDPLLKRVTAHWFYNLIGKLSRPKIPPDVGDFRLMDRDVVDALQRLPERSRFMKGIFAWVGFETTFVSYSRNKRSKGASKFNYRQLWNLALDGIFSFSTVPLKIWSYFGAAISLFSLSYFVVVVTKTIFYGIELPGYASLISVMLFSNGIIIMGLGIIGEYIARIFMEVKQRPIYIVASREGFDED